MLLAEQLVGEARARRQQRLDRRERVVEGVSAALYLAVALSLLAFVPSTREADPLLMGALVVGYVAVSRVRFEYSDVYVSAEQLVFIPMLVLVPIEWVPLLVAAAGLLSVLPEVMSGTWHHQRVLYAFSDSWFAIGPVLVILALAPELAVAGRLGRLPGRLRRAGRLRPRRRADPRQPPDPPTADRVPALVAGHRPGGRHPGADRVRAGARGPRRSAGAAGHRAAGVAAARVLQGPRRSATPTTLELNRAYRGTVMLLADVVESDDGYTGEHSRSVVELVQAVMDHLHVDPATRQEMEFAALLHDVGKISIPKEILNKPAKLTAEEFELMKTHTVEGQFLLDRVGGLLGRIGEVVRSCHERWDGKGYPDGLKGEQIPLAARIVFVCDAYNAMTTDRPYRSAMSTADALDELQANAGTQFDPTIVAALVEVVQDAQPESRAADDMRMLLSEVRLSDAVTTS